MFGGYWRGFGKGEGLALFLVRRSLVDIEGDLAKEKDLPFSWLRGVIYKLLDYETFKKLLSFLSFFLSFADFLDFGREWKSARMTCDFPLFSSCSNLYAFYVSLFKCGVFLDLLEDGSIWRWNSLPALGDL